MTRAQRLFWTMAGIAAMACPACTVRDARIPWDVGQMARELTEDLRRFEGLTSEAREIEVLAWQVTEREDDRRATPPGLPPVARRDWSEGALVWGRFQSRDGSSEWLVIHGFRRDGGTWRRALIFTEFAAPRRPLRPGETADGTWHGFQRFMKPPTSREICEFAEVSFLAPDPPMPPGDLGSRTRTGGLRAAAWQRVTGEEPACDARWDR